MVKLAPEFFCLRAAPRKDFHLWELIEASWTKEKKKIEIFTYDRQSLFVVYYLAVRCVVLCANSSCDICSNRCTRALPIITQWKGVCGWVLVSACEVFCFHICFNGQLSVFVAYYWSNMSYCVQYHHLSSTVTNYSTTKVLWYNSMWGF